MTEKEIARRLREALADNEPVGTINCDVLWELAEELDPSGPEPGTLVWWRYSGHDWRIGIARKRCVFFVNSYGDLDTCGFATPGFEWKPAYVAPPNTDPGTAALIDELQNRIAELEERQLAPDEVAVKVPPVSEWLPEWDELRWEPTCYVNDIPRRTIITRAEAEEMHRE